MHGCCAMRRRQAAWQVFNMPPTGVQDPGTPEEQWQVFQNNPQLLVAAPDDEVIAEILALQGELLQQVGRPFLQASLLIVACLHEQLRQALWGTAPPGGHPHACPKTFSISALTASLHEQLCCLLSSCTLLLLSR